MFSCIFSSENDEETSYELTPDLDYHPDSQQDMSIDWTGFDYEDFPGSPRKQLPLYRILNKLTGHIATPDDELYPLLPSDANVEGYGTFDFGPEVKFVANALPLERIPDMSAPATEVPFPQRIQAERDLLASESSPPAAAKRGRSPEFPPKGREARRDSAMKYFAGGAVQNQISTITNLSTPKRRLSDIHASPAEAGRASSPVDRGGEVKKRKGPLKKEVVSQQTSVAGFMKGHDDWLASMLGGGLPGI